MVLIMQIGETLKEARMEKGLSLDDIQEMTKIQKRYLMAIEQGNYESLPGRFYARAFIKEYAQAVGLDYESLLHGFDESSIQVSKERNYEYSNLSRSRRKRNTLRGASIFSLLPTVIVIILIVAIIFIAWTLSQKTASNSTDVELDENRNDDEIILNVDENEESNNEQTENETDEQEENEEETTDIDGANKFEVLSIGEESAPLSEIAFHYTMDDVVVTVEATETTYLEVKGDSGTTYYLGELSVTNEKEQFDVSNEERVYFNIGNTSGLTITFNGVELEYPVEPSEKVHQKLWVNLEKVN